MSLVSTGMNWLRSATTATAATIGRKPRRKHLVIGGICEDRFYRVEQLQPGAKHPAVAAPQTRRGGGAANVATALAMLDPTRDVCLLAQVGDDVSGRSLQRCMRAAGIDMPLDSLRYACTSESLIVCEDGGRSTIVTVSGAREYPVPMAVIERALADADSCVIAAHRRTEQIPVILRAANSVDVPVYLSLCERQIEQGYDEVFRLFDEGGLCDVVIMNDSEAARLTRSTSLTTQLERLTFGGRVRIAVVTRGTDGIDALAPEGHLHEPAYADPARALIDTTGAGDAAFAAIVDAIIRVRSLSLALRAAARNGFEACTTHGAASLDELPMQEYCTAAFGRAA